MIPHSPLAGLLTGLIDGLLIALLVALAVLLASRRRRGAPAVHPVAEDLPTLPGAGELPKAFWAHG